MPLPDVPGVIRLRVGGFIDGVPWNNIWYVRYTGSPPSSGEVADVANGMFASYVASTSLSSKWFNHTTINEVEGVDLSSSSGATGIHSGTVAGTITSGSPPPADTSLLCKLLIARRYRGGHPRKYLPPMAGIFESDERDWDLTTITALATAFGNALTTNLLIAFGSITVTELVNVSFYEGFTNYVKPSGRAAVRSNPRVTALVDSVAGFELEQTMATQRRRIGR